MLRQAKFGCLPVVEDDKLIGIITEHDLLGIVENLSD
jgi:CBS domain-containing protein